MLPTSLEEATARMMRPGSVARQVFGDEFVNHFGGTREHEVMLWNSAVTNWEGKYTHYYVRYDCPHMLLQWKDTSNSLRLKHIRNTYDSLWKINTMLHHVFVAVLSRVVGSHPKNCVTSCKVDQPWDTNVSFRACYRCDLPGHAAFRNEGWYHASGGARCGHAPFDFAIFQLHDTFNSDVSTFSTFSFKFC